MSFAHGWANKFVQILEIGIFFIKFISETVRDAYFYIHIFDWKLSAQSWQSSQRMKNTL